MAKSTAMKKQTKESSKVQKKKGAHRKKHISEESSSGPSDEEATCWPWKKARHGLTNKNCEQELEGVELVDDDELAGWEEQVLEEGDSDGDKDDKVCWQQVNYSGDSDIAGIKWFGGPTQEPQVRAAGCKEQ